MLDTAKEFLEEEIKEEIIEAIKEGTNNNNNDVTIIDLNQTNTETGEPLCFCYLGLLYTLVIVMCLLAIFLSF